MHTKRIAVGYGKKHRWIATPNPGAHAKKGSIPLVIVLRDILNYADSIREAKFILNKSGILVDKKVRKDINFSVGLMDVIEIPLMKKYFRVMANKKGLYLKEIEKKEANLKLCKIMNKRFVNKSNTQLNLHDGNNIILKKEDGAKYKPRETIMLELPERKIRDKIEFTEGNMAVIVGGRHSGEKGVVTGIVKGNQTRKTLIKIGEIETLADYALMLGKESKPLISI